MIEIERNNRPNTIGGITRAFEVGEGGRKWTATINVSEGKPAELFLHGGSDPIRQEQSEFMGKAVSLLLQYNVATGRIIKALSDIQSEPQWNGANLLKSVPDAIAKMLGDLERESIRISDRMRITNETQAQLNNPQRFDMAPRPQTLRSKTVEFEINEIKHTVIITLHNKKPFEVWVMADEQGSDTRAFHEALGRLVSIALRMGIPVEEITREMVGVKSIPTINISDNKPVVFLSATDAIGRIIRDIAGLDTPAPLEVEGTRPERAPTASARDSVTEVMQTGSGKVYVTVVYDDNAKPADVSGVRGKAGSDEAGLLEFACRLIGLAIRHGASTEEIEKMGSKIITTPVWNRQGEDSRSVLIGSVPHAVTHVLAKHAEGSTPSLI